MSAETAPHERRRLRVSLRVLMLLVLVSGVWMARQVNRARRQREAVAAVRTYGGWVHYDWEMASNGRVAPGRRPHAPSWLRRLLGDEYFQDIAHVSLVYDDSTGKRYDITNVEPADDVLARLASQTGITSLFLQKTQATDAGLKHLRGMTNLETLLIWDATELSDAGVAHLADLRKLRHVHISNSRISDRSLEYLGKLPDLEVMGLQGNRFSDAGLAHLKGSLKLKRLCVGLGENQITDRGLAHLKGLTNLQVLDVQRTRVTVEGLEQLRGLPKLTQIWISPTGITEAGKSRLKAAMPRLQVIQ